MGKYWFGLAGSAVIVGQCTRSGKYVSDSVSVSGMVSSSKAFTYMASPSISLIDCVGRPLRNTVGVCTFSNSAETLVKAHCLPLDTSLKRQSAWWILPLTVKSASDIIWSYFHSQFRRKYSPLSVNTVLWCTHCHVARIVIDWLLLTNILAYSQNHPQPARPKLEFEFGLAVLVVPKPTRHIDHRKPDTISLAAGVGVEGYIWNNIQFRII